MVILTNGINRVRDLLVADLFKCQAGSGTTAPTAADTALETPIVATLLTPTTTTASDAFQVTHAIASTIGSGSSFSEQEIQLNSGTDHFNRIVHTAITKGSNDEYTYITTVFIQSI